MPQAWQGAASPLVALATFLGASAGVAVAAWIYSRSLDKEECEAPSRPRTKKPKEPKSGGGEAAPAAPETPAGAKAAERKKRRAASKAAKAVTEEKLQSHMGEAAVAAGMGPRRDIVCADAVEWLARPGVVPKQSVIVTGLPDQCEVQNAAPTLKDWEEWFVKAAKLVLEALPPKGIAVFVQTDSREGGKGQVSKAALVLRAFAEVEGVKLLWHKVAHFGTVDEPSEGKVKYSHLLCFRRVGEEGESPEISCGIPDVLWRGLKPRGLKNAMRCFGVNTVRVVLLWASRQCGCDTVVDPFCGAGTVLAVGNALGLHAAGVDISARRVKQAGLLDGEALLAYERDVVHSAAHLKGEKGEMVCAGVKLSGRAQKQVKANFKGMSQTILKPRADSTA